MNTLSPASRRALKAKAHHLHPVASIGQQGLTEAVLREIEVALRAHELIKIRAYTDDRTLRESWMDEICQKTGAQPVQRIGKLFVVWRDRPEAEPTFAQAPSPRTETTARSKTGVHSAKAFAASARRKALAAAARRPAKPAKGFRRAP
jgi:RNA-binding protein